MTVEVLHYMSPNGRPVPMTTTINDAFEAPYEVLKMRGWRLAAEVLADGPISLTVEDDEQDFAQEIVANGPEVPRAIERIIAEAIALKPGLDDGFASDDAITTLDEEFDARESAARDTQQGPEITQPECFLHNRANCVDCLSGMSKYDDRYEDIPETRCTVYVPSLERKPGCCHNCGLPKATHVSPEPETPFDTPQEKA